MTNGQRIGKLLLMALLLFTVGYFIYVGTQTNGIDNENEDKESSRIFTSAGL